jgi:hypothetical protein
MTHTTQSRAEMIANLQGQAANAMRAVAEAQHQVAVIFGMALTAIVDIFNRTTNMEDRLQDESEARQALKVGGRIGTIETSAPSKGFDRQRFGMMLPPTTLTTKQRPRYYQ